jgi:hypothetical protein
MPKKKAQQTNHRPQTLTHDKKPNSSTEPAENQHLLFLMFRRASGTANKNRSLERLHISVAKYFFCLWFYQVCCNIW